MGSDIVFKLLLETGERLSGAHIGIRIHSMMGQRLCTLDSKVQSRNIIALDGSMTVTCRWRGCQLLPSEYLVTVLIKRYGDVVDAVENICKLIITEADIHNTGRVQPLSGIFEPIASWDIENSNC